MDDNNNNLKVFFNLGFIKEFYITVNFFLDDMARKKKGNLSAMIKLLPCDLKVTDSSNGIGLLQSRLRTIDASPESRIGRSFVHRTAPYMARKKWMS